MHATDTASLPPRTGNRFIANYLAFILFVLAFAPVLLSGLVAPHFFAFVNLSNMVRQGAIYLLLALGVAMCARVGGPDLSLGTYIALGAIIAVPFWNGGNGSAIAGILVSVAVCALIGTVVGLLVSLVRLPRFLVSICASLAVAYFLRGVALILTDGKPLPLEITPSLGSVTLLCLAAGFVLTALFFLISRGRKDSRLSCTLAFACSAALAALAGNLLLVRLHSAQPTSGYGYGVMLLYFYCAVTSSRLYARKAPSIAVAAFAAVYITVLSNMLNLLGVSSYYQDFARILAAAPIIAVSAYVHILEWRESYAPQAPLATHPAEAA